MKLWIVIIGLVFASVAPAEAVSDSKHNQITLQGHDLYLNGSGERTKFFNTVYIANLYVSTISPDAEKIINADEPQLMRLDITSSLITPERLKSSIQDGLKLSAGSDYAKYAAMLDQALDAKAVKINDGDQFDFLYLPGEGTYIFHNDKKLKLIPSFSFKQVLFKIWLGEEPIQSDLKKSLLKTLSS